MYDLYVTGVTKVSQGKPRDNQKTNNESFLEKFWFQAQRCDIFFPSLSCSVDFMA